MTIKEKLYSMSEEELAASRFICECPLTRIQRATMEQNGNPCPKDARVRDTEASLAEFIFSGQSKKICDECKLKWLNSEYDGGTTFAEEVIRGAYWNS